MRPMNDPQRTILAVPMTLSSMPLAALTFGVAALIAYLLPKLLVHCRNEASSEDPNGHEGGSRKSRLLQKRFGNLLVDGTHDLYLEAVDEGFTKHTIENEGKEESGNSKASSLQRPKTRDKPKSIPNKKTKTTLPSNSSVTTSRRPPFQNTSDRHPGLDAFRYWWGVQTSLYRIYTITRADGTTLDPPPYNPSSRRGQTSVDLRVTNETKDTINVFWINYKGGHESKGSIPPQHTWTQSTWIDHPWVFAKDDNESPIAHYIPYKIIPSVTPEAPTVEPTTQSNLIGIHRFSILEVAGNEYKHWIRDEILPLGNDIQSEQQALDITLLHCVRTGYYHWNTLLRYFRYIQEDPDDPKFRQIRIANRTFSEHVWNTAARGVFYCTGWVEQGAYVELGTNRSYGRSLDSIIKMIEHSQRRADQGTSSVQPEGADGFGRAGYSQ